jgi:hypothetical protein
MNRAGALLVVALAACGSGSSDPLFGGFTPSSGAAVILSPGNCSLSFVGPTALSGILVELSSSSNACNVLTQAQQCGTGASTTTLLSAVISGAVGAGSVAPVGPGTYAWLKDAPTGAFKTANTAAAKVDASCTSAAGGSVSMTGGSIAISAVTASKVSGSMDVQFDNGQVYKDSFDATLCPVSIDICSLFEPCFSHVCVQP